ncbi:13556_t:CDS:2 [Funneliformis geosporum]|uniref:13556_t:CDS:1 n=1 Tax=Funneliformis geosporum TaxID=1117311 RepID=A0A9W4SBH0_9GLOM|nr:13556_t:CDS:2 [Funneliformis geosporum]
MDHYGILGLPRTASERDIKLKYRRLVLLLHPDKAGVPTTQTLREEAEIRWADIQMAYDVLSDKNLKRNYDQDITCEFIWSGGKGYTHTTHNYPEKGYIPPVVAPPPETDPDRDYCCSNRCLEDLLIQKEINFTNSKCADHYYDSLKLGVGGLGYGGGTDILQADRDTAITGIENALNQNPPITNAELEVANQGWRNEIQNAPNGDTIQAIRNRVLLDITQKREVKNTNLTTRKNTAIDEIKTKLSEKPKIENSELNPGNQDQIKHNVFADISQKRQIKIPLIKLRAAAMEGDIVKAQSEGAINDIRERVLADIRNKRADKKDKARLDKLFSTNAYQSQLAEIKTIENRLRELNPTKYRERTKQLLNQHIKNNKLSEEELDEEALRAIAEVEQDPSSEKVNVAEEKIAVCGARKELKGILNKVDKIQNKQEKGALVNELLGFTNRNKFTEIAYHEKKSLIDNLISELTRGEVPNHHQNPEFPWLKVIGITALITLPIILIGFFILKFSSRRKKIKR